MDALITTIFAGVVVAVIGAFAAYYLGGRRERQKQLYEERSDLRERRVEALNEIRSRAESVVTGLKDLAERLAKHHAKIPQGMTGFRAWYDYLNEYEGLAQQRDAVAKQLASLRDYYGKQAPYLDTTSHNLFAAFDQEFERRFAPIERNLYSDDR
jgi:hypothetical protein